MKIFQKFLRVSIVWAAFSTAFSYNLSAQSTTCSELIRMVRSETYRSSNVGPMALLNSSWLMNVDYYRVDDIVVLGLVQFQNGRHGVKGLKGETKRGAAAGESLTRI